jgi:CarD-like/TRCF domain.
MKKINFIKILKKTFKKNKTKNKKKIKKAKVKKAKKIINLKKNKSLQKIKVKKEIDTKTSEKYRIAKNNGLKPEIKKIKKQETEKKEYKPNQYVVYPKHGVGKNLRIETVTNGEKEIQCYIV